MEVPPTTMGPAAMQAATTRSIWLRDSFSETHAEQFINNSKENNSMRCEAFVLVVLTAGLCSAALAGDIEGKVTGMKGHSVVYVEAGAGKNFPAPKKHPVMEQKRLGFFPHIMGVQQSTTVE